MVPWRRSGRILTGAVLGLGLAEAAARLLIGPPVLYQSDPVYEYRLRPGQDHRRFGHRILVNGVGMRSDALDPVPAPGTVRLLVLGDSVVNGGAETGHGDLATTRLDGQVLGGRQLEVLNLSAGSWGPGNMRAVLERFGSFGADGLILVLSGHDLTDDRRYGPRDPVVHPETAPPSILWNSLRRYLWPRIRPGAVAPPAPPAPQPGEARQSLAALLSGAVAGPAGPLPRCVVLHRSLDGSDGAALATIAAMALAAGVPVVADAGFLDPARAYRDGIHLTAAGQAQLAGALEACARAILPPPGG
ncbi:MAG: hypothetical protein JNK88_09820 [Mangrovicoccus sp.]|nr:hypothetical protein [Mangrovicoccus sp.]